RANPAGKSTGLERFGQRTVNCRRTRKRCSAGTGQRRMRVMRAKESMNDAEAALGARAVRFEGELSATAARALLKVRFGRADLDRMRALSAKARGGTLT